MPESSESCGPPTRSCRYRLRPCARFRSRTRGGGPFPRKRRCRHGHETHGSSRSGDARPGLRCSSGPMATTRNRATAPRRMTLAAVEARCAAKPDTVLTTPFGPRPHVYKTAGKMFALCGHLDGVEVVSLKCDPERSAMLRLTFPAITAGYHLHKAHWNTIGLDGSVPAELIRELIDHAHEVITASAKPRKRAATGRKRAATGRKRSAAGRRRSRRRSPPRARSRVDRRCRASRGRGRGRPCRRR